MRKSKPAPPKTTVPADRSVEPGGGALERARQFAVSRGLPAPQPEPAPKTRAAPAQKPPAKRKPR